MPDPAPAQPGLGGVVDLAVADESDIERRAAGVADQQVFVQHLAARLRLAVGDGGHRGHARARADRVDRPLDHFLRSPRATEGGGHKQVPGKACAAQVLLQGGEVLLHQGLQRGINHTGRRAAVLADDRVELVRQRERHTWQVLGDEFPDAQLVRRVDDRPEEADANRLHAEIAALFDGFPYRTLIERDEDVSLGVDALGDLEGEVARHIGGRVGDLLEGVQLATLAQEQDVREPLGGEEGRARGLPLDNGIGGAGGPVRKGLGAGQQATCGQAKLWRHVFQRRADSLEGAARRGERLADAQLPVVVDDHNVGKGSPGVNRDPIGHRLPLAFVHSGDQYRFDSAICPQVSSWARRRRISAHSRPA
ncbi:MAG: hypothetical protein U0075_18235 [Thermomicrobiales bacterium]